MLEETTDTFLLVDSLTGGQTYSFKLVVGNKYGEGSLASTTAVSIKTGQQPDAPSSVTTSVPNSDTSTFVQIDWVAPTANHYSILGYQIRVKQSDGSFTEPTGYCTGSDPSQTTCQVPMSILRSSPYTLSYSDNVIA